MAAAAAVVLPFTKKPEPLPDLVKATGRGDMPDDWEHQVIVFNGTSSTIYINGAEQSYSDLRKMKDGSISFWLRKA